MESAEPPPLIQLANNIAIRPWRPTDAPSLARSANNRKIWQNLRDRLPSPYTLAAAEWWIAHCSDPSNWPHVLTYDATGAEHRGERLCADYALVHTPADGGAARAIGSIGLAMGTDVARRSAELGYWLAEEWWGKGVMSEAADRFCAWAWAAFPGLVKIRAEVFAFNGGSGRVLEKMGFRVEGRARWAAFKDGRLGDVLLFGLVRDGV
ncbi:hypothetical protein MMC26_000470 [Xylographa opegraphella]|nr:hypothetical protein [Xylographa opegraphella]